MTNGEYWLLAAIRVLDVIEAQCGVIIASLRLQWSRARVIVSGLKRRYAVARLDRAIRALREACERDGVECPPID
jgi:hypothetical protein